MFGFKVIAAIKRGQSKPSVFSFERYGNMNTGLIINKMFRLHETVVAAGTADFNGKNLPVLLDIHFV